MRYGSEQLVAINLTGSPTAPVWTPIDEVCDDVTIDDDGDEVEAGTRHHGGVKQTVRARRSRGATLSLPVPTVKSAGNPLTAATPYAALLGASRQRVAVCDLVFFDQWTLDESGAIVAGVGVRMLAAVKAADGEPFGDRAKTDFEVKPGRAHPTSQAAYVGVTPLDLEYSFGDAAPWLVDLLSLFIPFP